jgi:hypothetical protein
MRFVKATLIIAALLLLLAAPAAATTLTSPSGTAYTSTIKAESGELSLHKVFGGTISCNNSTLEGKVEQHGNGVTAKGNLSSLTFSECGGNHVTVEYAGSLEVHATSGGNGIVTSTGAQISIQLTAFGISCVYTTSATQIGTLTGSNSTKAKLDLEGSPIPRTGGSFYCGSSGELTGSYTVTTPSTLYVDEKAKGTTLTSPSGTAYTSTIKAEAEGEVTLHGVATISCTASGLEGTVEQHGKGLTAGGKLSSLTFGECGSNDVTVKSPGSLVVQSPTGGNGTVKSTGAEVSVQVTSLGITCVYTTSETDIGTLTGSNSTNATLDVSAATIPRTGGSFFCGSSGEFTGNYKVTTPGTLYVELEPDPGTTLTSPSGTAYTSTIKAESGELSLHKVFGGTISCKNSTLEGKVEQHGNGVTASGNLSSLTFSECGNHVTVNNAGSLEVHATSGGNGIVTSTGAEISIQLTAFGISCVYTTNATQIGTLTGSNSTKAKLDLEGAKIPRTGGSIYCGSSGEWTGSYTVTTPSTLYVDEG